MTENLNTSNDFNLLEDTPKVLDEANLSTREFMEKNWDRLVSTPTSVGENQSLPVEGEASTSTAESPAFDALEHLEQAYEGLKNTLEQKGISSKEEWLKSLIEMEKMYHQKPEQFFRLMQSKNAERTLQNQGYDVQKLKEAVLQQGLATVMGLNQTLQQGRLTQPVYQPTNSAFTPIPQGQWGMTMPPQSDPLAQFKKPVNEELTSYLKDLVQKEFASMVQKNQVATKKAKDASFAPKVTQVPPSTSATHTPSGRLKTTREILEEGCRLLGI